MTAVGGRSCCYGESCFETRRRPPWLLNDKVRCAPSLSFKKGWTELAGARAGLARREQRRTPSLYPSLFYRSRMKDRNARDSPVVGSTTLLEDVSHSSTW